MVTLDLTVNLSIILSLIAIVSGFVALGFQAKSVKLEELALQAKVKDIQDLIKDIEAERETREAQIDERIDKEIEFIKKIETERGLREAAIDQRKAKEAEILSWASAASNTSNEILRRSYEMSMVYIEMLSVSLWALSNIARNPASIITEVCDAICAACCAIDDHIEMDKNTHRRLKSISEANRERTSLLSPDIMSLEEYSERMDAEIDRLKRELESASLLNTNDALESGKEINDARKQLYEVIEKMANEKGRNLPEFRGPGVQEKWPGSIN